MGRLNSLLFIAVILCALSVISATHQQRRLFVDLEHARYQAAQLRQQEAQLQYQQRALSKTARVEAIAIRRLGMSAISASTTHYLIDGQTHTLLPDHAALPAKSAQ
jgi:cell division protein FtsL